MRGSSVVLEEVQLLLDLHFRHHDQVLLVSEYQGLAVFKIFGDCNVSHRYFSLFSL